MKLYFRDLPCYQNLTSDEMKKRSYMPNSAFDLSEMPTEPLRRDFAAFIYDRSAALSFSSIIEERSRYHHLSMFITSEFPDLEYITDVPFENMENALKKYLVKNGIPLFSIKKKRGRTCRKKNPVLTYLKTVYDYFAGLIEPEDFDKDDDVWDLDRIPFMLYISPTENRSQISFTKILQPGIKAEIKEAALYHLKRLSVRTVVSEIVAVNNLSVFLSENFPKIQSLKDFDRNILEEYLTYLFLECKRRKDYRGELCNLKSILTITGKIFEYDHLRRIFLKSDFPKHRSAVYKYYSDSELERLHNAYRHLDKQTARLLLVHELLGLRISDTLTLKPENVTLSDDPHVRIMQPKTGHSYTKKLNDDLVSLLNASIEETTAKHGRCTYIFASDNDPDKPMKYSTLNHRLSSLINRLDLRDDNGNLFTANTHIFRHTYGKKLCDLLYDDATIAACLGHSSISSVSCYRQMSPEVLAENVQSVIDKRNDMILKYKKGWME